MSRFSNALRAKFYEHNGCEFNTDKYDKISEYLVNEYLCYINYDIATDYPYCDYYDYDVYMDKYRSTARVFIDLGNEVISITADRINPYTDEGNDCLYLKINKHYGRILCIDYIENMRFANSELDANNLGNIL